MLFNNLAKALDQPNHVSKVVSMLLEPGARVSLKGATGTGKTTIAYKVFKIIRESRPALFVSGDAAQGESKYLPLLRALEDVRRSKTRSEIAKESLIAPLLSIPFVGSTAAEFAKIAVKAQKNRKLGFLDEEQQNILQDLQRISSNSSLVVIIDDFEWVDSNTARLLLDFDISEVRNAYPFTSQVSILFVENDDTNPSLDLSLIEKLRPNKNLYIPRISRDDFPVALKEFGISDGLSDEKVDAIYSIVFGNLELTKQLSSALKIKEYNSIETEIDQIEVFSDLLVKRIGSTSEPENLNRLVSLAACIGSTFSQAEVRCGYQDNETFSNTLKIALEKNIFEKSGILIKFAHELLRLVADNISTSNKKPIHDKLGQCIKLLRPGDYSGRLRHSILAQNHDLTKFLAFANAVQSIRGNCLDKESTDNLYGLEGLFGDVKKAYRLMDQGEHRSSINSLTKYYSGEFNLVQGEIVALISLNQIKLRTLDGYRSAIKLLKHWSEYKEEADLWVRLMSILLAALVAIGDEDAAAKLYSQLSHDLMKASKSDLTSRNSVEALNRKADQIFTTEISIKHIERSVRWFSPSADGIIPRNSFEYTSGLVNLSAANFTLGSFSDAASFAADSIKWIDLLNEKGFRTAEPYKALNNYVISAFRSKKETAKALCDALNMFYSGSSSGWKLDRALLGINYSGLMLFAGRTVEAMDELKTIWDHLVNEDIDGYYAFYASSNLAVAAKLSGDKSMAIKMLKEASTFIDSIPVWFRSLHKKRIDFMIEAMDSSDVTSIWEIDNYPYEKRKANSGEDAWHSIGRGVLFSDIQVWSEA